MKRLAIVFTLASCAPVASPVTQEKPLRGEPAPVASPLAPSDALSVVHPGRAALDAERRRLYLARQGRVDVLDLETGAVRKWIDAGGELWPAGEYLVAHQLRFPGLSVSVIDPATEGHVATCSTPLATPPAAGAARATVFGGPGGAFVRWESSPPPEPPQGARKSKEQMAEWKRRVDEAYACGVLAIRIDQASCRLESVSARAAGIDRCDTRQLPPRLSMPARVGTLALAVREKNEPGSVGEAARVHTLTVTREGGKPWDVEVAREILRPMPP